MEDAPQPICGSPRLRETVNRTPVKWRRFAADPHGEHDFGALTIQGEKLFFKIDYYDCDIAMLSPGPSDPAVTRRVLTIMLASEN